MFIKEINIQITSEAGEVALSFMKGEKLKEILADRETLMSDFMANVISHSALSDFEE